jgi:tRNA-dihydrouridine synthase A
MITAEAILNGEPNHLLAFSNEELPCALQLGGASPEKLAKAAVIGASYGYSEINLNVGCPSSRVQAGRFGACLMKEPTLVAECISAIKESVTIPVTVKCRIGVDKEASYDNFYSFIETVKKAPCQTFIVHARKAWLKGLSPKENRTIPPLQYDYVQAIKQSFNELEIIVNGGITDLDEKAQFSLLDGIMVGREAYRNPYHLIDVDRTIYEDNRESLQKADILCHYRPYVESCLVKGTKLPYLLRHLSGLSHCMKGGAKWRKLLNEQTNTTLSDYDLVCRAFSEIVQNNG